LEKLRADNKEIGPGQACYIIAEAGVNHNGSVEKGIKLIDAALEADADAVKFQTFRADRLVVPGAARAAYQVANAGGDEDQLAMLQRLELSASDFSRLAEYCGERGITFLSSPFDKASVDLLCELAVPLLKIGSGELTNYSLLRYAAGKGCPLILSTGMADMREVEIAVDVVREAGCGGLALLHCVSNYPADPASVNLRAMQTLREQFGVPVGFSDHTRGVEVAIGAAALGADVLEKHLTLSRSDCGPDHAASLEPIEFKAMVYAMRNVEKALGDGNKRPVAEEAGVAAVARRSLFAACDIEAGATITETMLCARRPGTGMPPTATGDVVGRSAACAIRANEMIRPDVLV
jgi:N-acetylneuraminate synthase/N,N'-diacetyllegionaminate synthase